MGKEIFDILLEKPKTKLGYIFANMSGLGAYISNPIFVLKPGIQAGHFRTINPIIGRIFIRTYNGVPKFKKIAVRVLQMKI